VDSRVDPSDVLGLKLGEGVVLRNIGGRITPATLRSWALLGRLGRSQPPRSGHLVILHHTDCGIRRLAAYPEQLAAFFEIPADELQSKAVDDPYAAVRVDAAIARHSLPPSRLVSGLVYDVSTRPRRPLLRTWRLRGRRAGQAAEGMLAVGGSGLSR
jgi:carbonic anhydrase